MLLQPILVALELKTLRTAEDVPANQNVKSTKQYALMDVRIIQTLKGNLACPQCFKQNLALKMSNQSGFAAKLSVSCKSCDELAGSCLISEKIYETQNDDVNRRVVKDFTTLQGQRVHSIRAFLPCNECASYE